MREHEKRNKECGSIGHVMVFTKYWLMLALFKDI